MYLAKLKVTSFRQIQSLELRFKAGLNILVGPNNVGKTAVVDALRALLSTSDDSPLRVDEYDLHSTAGTVKASSITFEYVFEDLSVSEEADFLQALKAKPTIAGKPTKYEAHLSVRYSNTGLTGRLRPKRWCGDHEENAISLEMLEDLRAVYLPPLRDPASGLRPSRVSQLARLIDRLSTAADKVKLVNLLKTFEGDLEKEAPVAETQKAVRGRHLAMLGPDLRQMLQVGLTPPEFQRIAARLTSPPSPCSRMRMENSRWMIPR